MIIMALALGFSGFYFINYVFETSLEREIGQALDESSILGFAFETAALNVPAKYSILPDTTVEEIASNLEKSGGNLRLLRISNEKKEVLYSSDGFLTDNVLLEQAHENMKYYRVVNINEKYYVHTNVLIDALDRILYLETMKDITEVFKERELGFSLYRRTTLIILIIGIAVMHFLVSVLIKPIRILTAATKKMAEGDYAYRAEQVSNDELGQLTMDFNKMAGALEENVGKLEEEIQSREDFIAAFAHELKTPLTAIIGYADMLRSHKLDEEKSFMSANYIYTEGKRLESMSFRLLDIIVTKKEEIELQNISVETVFKYLQEMFVSYAGMNFKFEFENATVCVEVNLIKAVLINLIDNACKASEEGSIIEINGYLLDNGYRFAVRDYGVGIPKGEQHKITKAFYMVDKSRARSKNGAGLGLALCAEILYLHNSELEIESELGKGSCISFVIPMSEGVYKSNEKQENY